MKQIEFTLERNPGCRISAWLHDENGSHELAQRKYPAIIICPGGAYQFVSDREDEPVAMPFIAAGYNTLILRYDLSEGTSGFRPLCQLADTIRMVRKHAEEWFTKPDRIAVCGFSAGGHLAASLGVWYDDPVFTEVYGKADNLRPDAMILGYPVITADEFAHVGSIENVSGSVAGTEEYRRFGLEQYVSDQTPPTFLWHTASDQAVPVENSLKMAEALSRHHVPYELHILPEGAHGMSVCTHEVGTPSAYNARWIEWAIRWLNKVFDVAF